MAKIKYAFPFASLLVLGLIVGCNYVSTGEGLSSNSEESTEEPKFSLPSYEETSNDPTTYSIKCLSGTQKAFLVDENTITFNTISADSVYSISGEFNGNIIIDVGETYNFDLEMHGFTLSSKTTNPITILSGNNVSLVAKKDFDNFIYDYRDVVDSTDTTLYSSAIYSEVDLDIQGKGSLVVISENNNGIHTKDDLEVKNLTLSVTCKDNALKGNDSVTLTECNTTLISKIGDGIKTVNSDISTKGNQRGIISISSGTHNIYAACDGLDAAYDVLISGDNTKVNINTDKYSEYSEEVTAVSENKYYLRASNNTYNYSVKYYNSESDFKWENAEFFKSVSSGRSTYYYYTINKPSNYDKLIVYMYIDGQDLGQDSTYYACSTSKSINDSYDTITVSYRQSSLSINWTNFTTNSSPGGMGGMNEGNTDKGDHSTKGIKSFNEIVISGGVINVKSYDDGIHANNDVVLENGETPIGNVTISGGNVTVYSNDDGIHADGTLMITDGDVKVTNSYEGIEGTNVNINGGKVSVISNDDGVNGTSTSGASITVSNGYFYVYAKGDGVDSNSTTSNGGIVFSGGKTIIICNSNGNSAIDSERGYSYQGGSVIALTPSGGMSSESTNCSNFNSVGTQKSISLTKDNYLKVDVSSSTISYVKLPCSMSSITIYLGSNNASISSLTSCTQVLDENGVYWAN